MIQPFSLVKQNKMLQNELLDVFEWFLKNPNYIKGQKVTEFEDAFGKYLGYGRSVIGVNSGTDALTLAIKAMIKLRDLEPPVYILCPAFTFMATASAIVNAGALPVFVDVDPNTFLMNGDDLKARSNELIDGIVPVHLFGRAENMDLVMELADDHDWFVVEDCAQACGSKWDGRPVGTFGNCGCFSFFPTKNLGCFGDGGAIVTGRDTTESLLRMMNVHGSCQKYRHDFIGYNSRLDAIQAAILSVKLKYLNEWIDKRREIAKNYSDQLQGLVKLPETVPGHSWNQYTIMTDKRDELQEFLKQEGVGSTVYYPSALSDQQAFSRTDRYRVEGYKKLHPLAFCFRAEEICKRVLSLPIYPEFEEVETVCKAIRKFKEGAHGVV